MAPSGPGELAGRSSLLPIPRRVGLRQERNVAVKLFVDPRTPSTVLLEAPVVILPPGGCAVQGALFRSRLAGSRFREGTHQPRHRPLSSMAFPGSARM